MRLSTRQAFELVCQVEEGRDLLALEIGRWCAWPLFRFGAARALIAGLPTGSALAATPMAPTPGTMVRDLLHVARRRTEVLYKTYASGLVERNGSRYVDVWFDDVIRSAGPGFKIEEAVRNFATRRSRVLTPIDVHFESVNAMARVVSRARSLRSRPHAAVAARLSSVLREDLGLTQYTPTLIEGVLRHFDALRAVYGWILQRVEPRSVLVADPGEHALAAAAKERGIPVMELQHGVMDSTHAGYAWTAYAARYRGAMPLPDRLLLYGEHWKREMENSGFWGDSLRVVGSPRIDRYRAGRAERNSERRKVLVTTQGIEIPHIVDLAKAVVARAPGGMVHIVIRLHPTYDPDVRVVREMAAGTAGVTVSGGNEEPSTFELLVASDLHLSVSSTVHYDALALGIPTAILPYATSEIVQQLHELGHARFINTPADVLGLLADSRRVEKAVSHYYAAEGAVGNILRELQAT